MKECICEYTNREGRAMEKYISDLETEQKQSEAAKEMAKQNFDTVTKLYESAVKLAAELQEELSKAKGTIAAMQIGASNNSVIINKLQDDCSKIQKIIDASITMREELRGYNGKSGVTIQAPAKKMIKILSAFGEFDEAIEALDKQPNDCRR